MRKLALLWMMAGCGLVLGCGDSDGGETDAGDKDAGHDAGYTPPRPRVDSGSQDPEPMEFMCEDTMCTVPELDTSNLSIPAIMGMVITPELIASMGFGPMGCCVEDSKCGVTQEGLFGSGFCAEQGQVGEPDTDCPDEQADIMGLVTVDLIGCCRSDGKCGINLDLIGVGCVERTEAAMIEIMGMTLPNADMIEAIDCTFGAGGSDAGTL
jgi:hypothetical protein